MSDENKQLETANNREEKGDLRQDQAKMNPKVNELSEKDLNQVNGGIAWGDIKGGSTDDKHKDWSEVVGFSQGMTTT